MFILIQDVAMLTTLAAEPVLPPPSNRLFTPEMYTTLRLCSLAPDHYPARQDILAFIDRCWKLLGIGRVCRDFLSTVVLCTKAADWREGGFPRCWAHNEWFTRKLGLSENGIRRCIRTLAEAGILVPIDRPNCHRRAPQPDDYAARGYLDLRPIQHAWSAWLRMESGASREAEECAALREDIAASHRRLKDALLTDPFSQRISDALSECRILLARRRRVKTVADLKQLAIQADALVRVALSARISAVAAASCTSKLGGMSPTSGGRHTESFIGKSTSMARRSAPDRIEECGVGQDSERPGPADALARSAADERRALDRKRADIPPRTLIALCPPIRDHLPTSQPDIAACIDAGGELATAIGITQPVWAEACVVLGRYRAAIAISVLATRMAEGVTILAPAAYILAECRREERGEFHLARSIQRLRYLWSQRATEHSGTA